MSASASSRPGNKSEKSPSNDERAPLLSHLLALRRVILISLSAVVVAFFLVFYLFLEPLMSLIIRPIADRGIDIIYTAVSEALTTKIKVCLIAALIIAAPVIFWQIWCFVRPAFMPKTQKSFLAVFFLMLFLFVLGVLFCIFAVYSVAIDFFIVQGNNIAKPLLSLDKYVSFLFGFVIPFGFAFQLPLAMYLSTKAGITSVHTLSSHRKYVILGVFILAAVLTPPDIISQVALGIPLCLLYEAGILAARMVRPVSSE